VDDIKALTVEDVAPLYKEKYWDAVRGDELPAGVDHSVFDCAVNGGVKRAASILQACVGADPDGHIGPGTLAAVSNANPADVIEDFADKRLKYLQLLTTFDRFGKGWTRRVNEVEDESKSLLQG
jgi:lysozyme family protein